MAFVGLQEEDKESKDHAMITGRRGGLMVSGLVRWTPDRAVRIPGRGTALCSWARYVTLIVPLSTQVYKWTPANLQLRGNPAIY